MITQVIATVNRLINNAVKYKEDEGDHWQPVSKTMALGTGDCEDYAIAKMAMLCKLMPAEDLRLAQVRTPEGVAHMVLFAADYVLDIICDELVVINESDYKPEWMVDANGQLYSGVGKPLDGRSETFNRAWM